MIHYIQNKERDWVKQSQAGGTWNSGSGSVPELGSSTSGTGRASRIRIAGTEEGPG